MNASASALSAEAALLPEFSVSLDYALDCDAADILAPYRRQFELPRGKNGEALIYLCGHSLGLAPRAALDYVSEELAEWAEMGVAGHHAATRPWIDYAQNFTKGLQLLTGALPSEVVVMNSLTINLHLLMASFYRPTNERHVVLIEQGAFPSDRYAVASQVGWHGRDPAASLVQVGPRAGEFLLRHEDLVAEIERQGSRLALLLLPGVQYLTGQRLDIAGLAEAAHRVGAVAGFDLAHAIGNLPLELHRWNVDFAAWCSYKYLNGGPGATAGAFVHERHFGGTAPRLSGWWGNDLESRFEMAETFRPYRGAAGWQVSNHPLIGMVPLQASFAQFANAGLPSLRERSQALTGWLERLLDAHLGERIEILTPRDPEARGAQLSVRLRGTRGGGRALFDRLLAAGLTCDWREPDVIRLAPAPLYNSYEDCWRAVALIEEELDAIHA
jgi:kynureninase